MAITLVQKQVKFNDNSTAQGTFATDGTNIYPVTLLLDENGTLLTDDASAGLYVRSASLGSNNIATSQTSVAATATLIVAARSGRNAVTIENTGTTAVYLGASGVTVTTGMLLPGVLGASITIPTSAAVYGISAASAQTVSVLEVY